MTPVRRRGPLGRTIVLLTTLVAALTAALTGVIAWQTAASGAEQREFDQLMRQATIMSDVPGLSPLIFNGALLLGGPNGVDLAVVSADGAVSGTATPALGLASKAELLAGQEVSTTGILGGQEVLLVGHPAVGGGAIVLTESYSVVTREIGQVRRNILWPLAVGTLVAALAGALLARRTASPLVAAARRTPAGGRRTRPASPRAGPARSGGDRPCAERAG